MQSAQIAMAVCAAIAFAPQPSSAKANEEAVADQTQSSGQEATDEAGAVVALLFSDERLTAATRRMVDQDLRAMMLAELGPASTADEKRAYLAYVDDAIGALTPILLKLTLLDADWYRGRATAIYADALSAGELGLLLDFYADPLGLAVVDKLQQNASSQRLVMDSYQGVTEKADSSQALKDMRASAAAGLNALSEEETAKFRELLALPMAPKLAKIAPRLAELNAEAFDRSTPEIDQEIEEALSDVFARYFPDLEDETD